MMCEYIAEIKLSCGCVGSGAYVDYCDLHRSAPLLAARVERLETALSMLIERVDFDPVRHMDGVFSALIKAKQALEDSD